MNGEKLLRAMSYVEEDLVDRAEKTTRRKRSPWVRVAALAACLCLVLGGWMMIKAVFPAVFSAKNAAPASRDTESGDTAKTQAIMDAPVAEKSGEEAPPRATEEAGMESAMATGAGNTGDWFVRMETDSGVNASDELSFPTVVRSRQALDGFSIPTEVLERYGEDFFETQDLLLAAVEGGAEHPQVVRLENTGEGWVLTVSAAADGEDAIQWRLLLPIEKDQIQEDEEITIKEEETK